MDELSVYLEKNIGLVHKVTGAVMPRVIAANVPMDYEDVFQEVVIVFMRAYKTYDPSQKKFSTYFMCSAWNEMNRIVGRGERSGKSVSLSQRGHDGQETFVDLPDMSADPCAELEMRKLLTHLAEKLSPSAMRVVEMCINPPDELESELIAQQLTAQAGRDAGNAVRAPREITASFVMGLMEKVGALSRKESSSIRKELALIPSLMSA